MSFFSSIAQVFDGAVNTVTEHPLETAALATGAYFALPALTAEAGAAAFAETAAVSEGAVTATELGTLDASTAGLSGIDLGGAGGSPASWLTPAAEGGGSAWSTGQVLSTATSGLNLATNVAKLGAVTKMNPTANGLTSALASGPSTVVTTPNGPEAVATQKIGATTAAPSVGVDTQTMLIIGAAAIGIWFLMKKA
jgi:hypothetical protein